MPENLEKIIRVIYSQWKGRRGLGKNNHPDEEKLACFAEGKLLGRDKALLEKHLLNCALCAEYVFTQLKIKPHLSLDVPEQLLENTRKLVIGDAEESLFEIFLKLKDKALEIIRTTGDVLVGQELVPAPVLRSRKISEFKEEINILKDFQELRVLAKIQSKNTKNFNLTVIVKDKINQKIPKNTRISLIKDEVELESYVTDSGSGYFENIQPGNYTVEISSNEQMIALVDLKVNP